MGSWNRVLFKNLLFNKKKKESLSETKVKPVPISQECPHDDAICAYEYKGKLYRFKEEIKKQKEIEVKQEKARIVHNRETKAKALIYNYLRFSYLLSTDPMMVGGSKVTLDAVFKHYKQIKEIMEPEPDVIIVKTGMENEYVCVDKLKEA